MDIYVKEGIFIRAKELSAEVMELDFEFSGLDRNHQAAVAHAVIGQALGGLLPEMTPFALSDFTGRRFVIQAKDNTILVQEALIKASKIAREHLATLLGFIEIYYFNALDPGTLQTDPDGLLADFAATEFKAAKLVQRWKDHLQQDLKN